MGKVRRMTTARLWRALEKVGDSAAVLCSGVVAPVIPGLEIEGLGPLGLPPTSEQLEQVVSLAQRAPYGKGQETILDLSVRRVWQLEPSQFHLTNPEWSTILREILERVSLEFSLGQKIQASLYKLLLYEPGGFFAPHRDTEKVGRMFATLVVCLPSRHTGGVLRVEHEGRTHEADFSLHSEFRTQFAAFYADCLHQVQPVESGYRLCLVYNLTLKGSAQPQAPRLDHLVEPTVQALQGLFETGLSKVAIQLSHEYTPHGLSPDDLKGSDRARFEVLALAAQRSDLECRLGLLTLEQEGSAEEYYDRYHRGPRRYTLSDVDEEKVQISHLIDSQGQRREKGPWTIDEDELLLSSPKAKLAWKRSVHEATGNEGVSIERRYRTAVAVLWPRDGQCRLIASQGQEVALPYLNRMLKASEPRERCLEWARAILDMWQVPLYRSPEQRSQSRRMLACLRRLGDLDLACRFLQGHMRIDCDGREGPALVKLAETLGWEKLGPSLLAFFDLPESQPWTFRQDYLKILHALCCEPPDPGEARRRVASDAAQTVLALLQSGKLSLPHQTRAEKELEILFSALVALGAFNLLDSFVSHALACPAEYHFYEVLLPSLGNLGEYRHIRPYQHLWEGCAEQLRESVREPVKFPQDWARGDRLRCRCEPCRGVEAFLRDPVATEYRYRARESLRNHVQWELKGKDVNFRVEVSRPSHTLVIRKTLDSYHRRQTRYEQDVELLKSLNSEALRPLDGP